MRGFRLNGWQRIGIVLSVLWALSAVVWVPTFLDHRAMKDFKVCIDVYTDFSMCQRSLDRQLKDTEANRTFITAAVALAPVVISWLLIIVATVRWVRRGFQPAA
jgi:hypothetical protein